MLYSQPDAVSLERGMSNIVEQFIKENERLWQLQRNNSSSC